MKGLSAGILAIVLMLSILGPLVSAESSHDEPANSEEEEDFESEPRTVEVDARDDRLEFRSIGVRGDRLRFEFRPGDGELRLDFVEPENNTVEVQLEVSIEALMEYIDEDMDGFDVTEDVIRTFEISKMPFEVGPLEVLEDGYAVSVDYFLFETDMVFGLTFWIFENETLHEGVLVHPTEVKFDVRVSFFPFESEVSSLALVMELQTEVEPRANFTGTDVELEAIGDRYGGFFRWNKTAVVDDVPVTVGSAVIKRETEVESGLSGLEVERTVVLSYPQGERIFHDPVVGVAAIPVLPPPPEGPDITEPIPQLNTFTYGVMLGLASLFVLVTLLARGRRRG
jgi:hypothetical protein